jgi:hypothetical protein
MNRTRTLLPIFLLFAALLPGAAPAKSKAAPVQTDAAIEQNIRARFAKSKVAEDKFTVRVQGGVAVIEGTTSIIQRKGVATRLAKAGGAKAVDNRIRISDEVRQKAAEKLRSNRPRQTDRIAAEAVTPSAPQTPVPSNPPPPVPIPRAIVKH